jgi:hypothetical protein
MVMRGISPQFIKKFGFKKVIFFAPIGIFFSLISIGFITRESSYIYICICCFFLGFFNILLMSSNGPMIYVDIPKNKSANATSLDITIRQFSAGLSVGLVSFLSQDEHPSLGGATFIDDEMLYAYRIATITGIIKSHHIYTVTGVLTLPA